MEGKMTDNFLAQEFGKSQYYTDIKNSLFKEHGVKKGLRNEDGTGVRVGLTRVSDVVGYDIIDGVKTNIDGYLYYRGYSLNDLVEGNIGNTNGFEETMFLLLFGFLPSRRELDDFSKIFRKLYKLPDGFLEMNLLRMPGQNLMNVLQSSVLSLYNFDEDPDNVEVFPTLVKGLSIVAKLPAIMCYAYQSKMHHFNRDSLFIHYPKEEYSVAENILHLLRSDGKFDAKEADLLDMMLMLHADHGGGNNSTFTNVVVSSTGTDIYSTIAASIGSLKGPKHGGANISVAGMMEEIIATIGITNDENKIKAIINKILDKEFYDKSGLIYGFGHAVYTITDPRAELLKSYCEKISKVKNRYEEYKFYELFERLVKEIVMERKGRTISNNVDYYSGFAYDMLGIPRDLFTPLFVCARTIGWIAHNIENKLYDGKIMRPATKYVGDIYEYQSIKER
jgi:citrate (Si)-synthase